MNIFLDLTSGGRSKRKDSLAHCDLLCKSYKSIFTQSWAKRLSVKINQSIPPPHPCLRPPPRLFLLSRPWPPTDSWLMQTQLNLFISAMTLELRYAASQAFVSGLGLKAAEFVMLLLLLLLIFCCPLFTGESNPCVFFFCEQFRKKKKKQTKNSTISSYSTHPYYHHHLEAEMVAMRWRLASSWCRADIRLR